MRRLMLALALLAGCGDDPCTECPAGTRCERVPQKPGDSFMTARWDCLQVVKEITRLEGPDPGSGR